MKGGVTLSDIMDMDVTERQRWLKRIADQQKAEAKAWKDAARGK